MYVPHDTVLHEVDNPIYPFQLTRNRKLLLPPLAMADFPTVGNTKSLVIELKSVPWVLTAQDPFYGSIALIRGNVDSNNWGGESGECVMEVRSFGGTNMLTVLTFFNSQGMYNNMISNEVGTAPTEFDPARVWTLTITVKNIDGDAYGASCKVAETGGWSIDSGTPEALTLTGLATLSGSLRLFMGDVKGFIDTMMHDVTVLSVTGWA